MSAITDQFDAAFSDYNTDGVPASGIADVKKAAARAIGPIIDAAIGAIAAAGLAQVKFDTKAHMDADLAHAAGTVALVYADPTAANNDLWVKSGASGAGSWVLSGNAGIIHDTIEAQAQPYVDEASSSAAAAATSAGRYDRISAGERNMFDKSRVTAGKAISNVDGTLVNSAGNNASHQIPVVGGQWFTWDFSSNNGNSAWYDKDGVFISGLAGASARPVQAPASAAFFQTTVADAALATRQFERGKTPTPYAAYNEGYRQSKHFYRVVPNAALQALVPKKNLVDPARLLADYYVINTNGTFASNNTYNLLLPVPIAGGTTYYSNMPMLWACYDANMGYLSGGVLSGSLFTLTTHASAVYFAAAVDDAHLASWQLEKGLVATAYEAFTLVFDPTILQLTSASLIADGAIGTQKLALAAPAKNMFNPADPDATAGYVIIAANGGLFASANYNCTGFMPVVAGETYMQTGTAGGAEQFNAWYDANKAYLGTAGNTLTLVAPAGAAYLRCSYFGTYAASFQVERGRIITQYEPYRLAVPDAAQPERAPGVILPRKTYVFGGGTAVGTGREQANLYLSTLARGVEGNWNYDCDGAYGMQLGDAGGAAAPCWRIEPGNTSGVGSSTLYNIAAGANFTLGITLAATNGRAAAYASTTVYVVDKTANTGSAIRHLGVGDSITDWRIPTTGVDTGVNYLQQIPKKLSGTIKLQGTKHYSTDHSALNREGRSGWSLASYFNNYGLQNGDDSPFMQPDGITAAVYKGNVAFWAGVVNGNGYSGLGYEKIARGWLDSGSFLYGSTGYPTAPSAGDVVFDYSKGAGHYFQKWNGSAWVDHDIQAATWSFSFAAYLTRYAAAFADGNPTHVSIMLNANDFNASANPKPLADWKANMDTFIASIHAVSSSIKVIVCLGPLGGDQDSWTSATGSGQAAFRYNENMKAAWQYILGQYDNSVQEAANVLICAPGLRVDPIYGFDRNAAENPNIYATTATVTRQTSAGGPHPNSSVGQPQMGDALAAIVQATR